MVPTIHILDLGAIVLNLADSRSKTRYILAVDDSHYSLAELVRAVGKNLGNGLTQRVPKEEALVNREVSVSVGARVSVSSYQSLRTQQLEFDQLLVNLQMEAGTAKEGMRIDWKSEVLYVGGGVCVTV